MVMTHSRAPKRPAMAIIGIRCAISQVAWVCRRSWRWNPPYSGQAVVVDGGIEDGAKQRQVGVHRPGCKALADHRRLPRPDGAWVQICEWDVVEGAQDARLNLPAGAVLRAWVLVFPGWPPLGGHVLADRVRALTGSGSVGWECLAALALEGPPLGLGAHGGRCRPSVGGCRPGCGPGSAREGGGEGGTITIQAITMPPCRRSPDEVRPALRMSPTEFRMRRPQ